MDSDKAAHKREEKRMSSAVYELGLTIMQANWTEGEILNPWIITCGKKDGFYYLFKADNGLDLISELLYLNT